MVKDVAYLKSSDIVAITHIVISVPEVKMSDGFRFISQSQRTFRGNGKATISKGKLKDSSKSSWQLVKILQMKTSTIGFDDQVLLTDDDSKFVVISKSL